MSDKIIQEIDLKMDEVTLSVMGWDSLQLRARVVQEESYSGKFKATLTVSGSIKFDPGLADNTYFDEKLPCLAAIVTSPELPNSVLIYKLVSRFDDRSKFTKHGKIHLTEAIGQTDRMLNLDDLTVTVTAFDTAELDRYISFDGQSTSIPVQIEAESEVQAKFLDIKYKNAVINRHEGVDVSLQMNLHSEGVFELARAKLSAEGEDYDSGSLAVSRLECTFDLYDDTDFLLENSTEWLYLQFDYGGTPQKNHRPALTFVTKKFSGRDFAGTPARCVITIGAET